MTKLILPMKEFNKMPYSGTETSWTKTKGEIEGILYNLRSKGILKKHGWVTVGEADDEVDTLYMELEIQISDTQVRTIELKFEPTMIYTERWVGSVKRGDKRTVLKLHRNTSWRLFYWHFKSKIEAALYGLVTLENEFMSNIVRHLTDGREVTFGDALKMLLLEDKIGTVLEDMRDRKPIEAEVV